MDLELRTECAEKSDELKAVSSGVDPNFRTRPEVVVFEVKMGVELALRAELADELSSGEVENTKEEREPLSLP